MYSDPMERKAFHQHIFYACQTIRNSPGTFIEYERPYVSMRALIVVEDILNVCCELWLDRR
jgi:benzoyl-CoA reductase/2-hydroxyglutaryl-CoA dehydratase subunit BcrC/BadD/HgdB